MLDVTHDLSREIALGSEDAARDQVAFDLREPVFNLVQPRRIGGREVQMDFGVIGEELLNAARLVRRQIVENDVDLVVSALTGDDSPQEGRAMSEVFGLGNSTQGTQGQFLPRYRVGIDRPLPL